MSPRALRVAEVDLYTGIDLEVGMLCHFRALIPRERSSQFLGKVVMVRMIASRTASARETESTGARQPAAHDLAACVALVLF